MKFVQPSSISGQVTAPVSKSILQRLMIADFLSDNLKDYYGILLPDDVEITFNALKNIQQNSNLPIYLGESGFCYRVLPIIASLKNNENIFSLSLNLGKRSNLDIFQSIGLNPVIIDQTNENLYLKIEGKLQPSVFKIEGSITSQLLTGLLMALPTFYSSSMVFVNKLKSKSYINLTIEILKKYSIQVFHNDYEVFHISGNQNFKNVDNFSEGDWSGAAFLISAAIIAGNDKFEIHGLNSKSHQADIEILDILHKCEANYYFKENVLTIEKSKVKSFEHDFSNCPDLVPAIIPLAINADEVSVIKNIERLKYKESNRIEAIINEYKKCGIKIEMKESDLHVFPGVFRGGTINTHSDHRIAMSLAVAGLNGQFDLCIEAPECVNKSYPLFWNDLNKLGAKII